MPGFFKRGTTPLQNKEILLHVFEDRLIKPLKVKIPTEDLAKMVDEVMHSVTLKYGLYKATAEEIVKELGIKFFEYRNLHGLGKHCSKCGLNKK
jgi:hypothetical protein